MNSFLRWWNVARLALCALLLAGVAMAQEAPALGPETNLPVPRFVSLNASEANVRRGPSLSHRIDWVFTRRNMPLQLVAEYGQWRRVIDRDGQGGWIHYTLLSGARTVLISDDDTALRSRPDVNGTETAILESGVIARLGKCETEWCQLTAGGYRGWVPKAVIWGVALEELRD
ncbi:MULTISPECIES: SH3 domain-containing protein [unclassified Yoonia]|uniref:SH3 domain-containing protein n=1 Tax=unclassified Yoonia TaxID=2629118 RepID=UPI002AFE27C2|nr:MULTISPECIES: SH3 domain-containing protein [unclassified Yoonia]